MPDYWKMILVAPVAIILVAVGFVSVFRLNAIDRARAAQMRKLAAETLARIDVLIELNERSTTPCPCADCEQAREKRRSTRRDQPGGEKSGA